MEVVVEEVGRLRRGKGVHCVDSVFQLERWTDPTGGNNRAADLSLTL